MRRGLVGRALPLLVVAVLHVLLGLRALDLPGSRHVEPEVFARGDSPPGVAVDFLYKLAADVEDDAITVVSDAGPLTLHGRIEGVDEPGTRFVAETVSDGRGGFLIRRGREIRHDELKWAVSAAALVALAVVAARTLRWTSDGFVPRRATAREGAAPPGEDACPTS